MRRSLAVLSAAVLALGAAARAASLPAAGADETPIPKLEKHPWSDAKPGEWRRFKHASQGEARFLVERVIATKPEESKVFYEVRRTSEDGKEVLGIEQAGRWIAVPKLEPVEGQEFTKDEMVMFELGDRKIPARHFRIVEPVVKGAPYPTRTRDVWFSNEALGNGKLQEWSDNPSFILTAIEWGTMPAEELAKVRQEYKMDPAPADGGEKPAPKPDEAPKDPAPKPGDKPAGGGGSSCGGK